MLDFILNPTAGPGQRNIEISGRGRDASGCTWRVLFAAWAMVSAARAAVP